MTRYRKKPVVIEAVQYHLQEFADNPLTFEELPEWLTDAINSGAIKPEFRGEDYWYLVIKTLEGDMDVTPNDWIIRGVEGELYPCKPSIFAATYEPVVEDHAERTSGVGVNDIPAPPGPGVASVMAVHIPEDQRINTRLTYHVREQMGTELPSGRIHR